MLRLFIEGGTREGAEENGICWLYSFMERCFCAKSGNSGLVFPIIFHAVGLGSAFLPMFFPIIAAGFLIALPSFTAG
jgi:hypothetical protein